MSDLSNLEQPTFQQSFRSFFELRRTQLTNICSVKRGAEEVFFDVFPNGGLAPPFNTLTAALDNSLITPEGVREQDKIIRRRTVARSYGRLMYIPSVQLDQLPFSPEDVLMRKFIGDMNQTIETVIVSAALGRGNIIGGTDSNPFFDFATQDLISFDGILRIPNYVGSQLAVSLADSASLRSLPAITTTNTATDGSFLLNDLIDSKTRLLTAAKTGNNVNLFLIVNPGQMQGLYKDTAVTNTINNSRELMTLTGYAEEVIGFNIIQTIAVPLGFAICMTGEALGLAMTEPITQTQRSLTKGNGLTVASYMNIGAAILREDQIDVLKINH